MTMHEEDDERNRRAIAARRVSRRAALTRAVWGADGQQVPHNMVKLEGTRRRDFLFNLVNRAQAEREGRVAGDAATVAVESPAMQRALEEEAQRGRS